MIIGITERGDVQYDDSWITKFEKTDFSILISKGLPKNQKFVIENKNKIIFHATTTGLGNSIYEPNVINPKQRLDDLNVFCNNGFPKKQVVIRVDPIIATKDLLKKAIFAINYATYLGFNRFRYSFLDMYSHVEKRFKSANLEIPKIDNELIKQFLIQMKKFEKNHNVIFETCAENNINIPYTHKIGCISENDMKILNINGELLDSNIKQRPLCLCPKGKTELLTNKKQCPNKCIYCYWR